MLYLLDANVLIDADRDYYPIDRVPQFWDWLLDHANAGRLKVPLEIYEEVVAVKDVLPDWLKNNRVSMVLDEEADPEIVNLVLSEGYADDLTDVEVEQIGKDPFLIAYALADLGNRCVVTNEVSKPRRIGANRHIPDVCSDLNIRCRNTFDLVRELDFRTDRRTP